MIRILEGEDPDSVRDRIAATVQRAEVVTLAGITEKMDERLSYFTQMAVILGSVSLFVAALLIGTITAVSVSERLGIIAALRAIGISRRRIVGDLTAESAILCAVGGGIGVGLSLVVARYLESILASFPGLPAAVSLLRPAPGEPADRIRARGRIGRRGRTGSGSERDPARGHRAAAQGGAVRPASRSGARRVCPAPDQPGRHRCPGAPRHPRLPFRAEGSSVRSGAFRSRSRAAISWP